MASQKVEVEISYPLTKTQFLDQDRVHSDVEPPVADVLQHDQLFDGTKIRVNLLKEHFRREGRITTDDIFYIVETATDLIAREPNLLTVPAPVTVCGDVHGQYFDLLKLFEVGGDPSETTFLFLGDYVDRGYFSIECVLLLYAYKITYPETFFLLRGNHECRHLTDYFTFKEECKYKYDEDVYDVVMDSFDALPLAAIVNDQFLCVHGGLSPALRTLDDITSIDRFREPPQNGLMCDMLWADPADDFDEDTASEQMFRFNEVRGCSFFYGYKAACDFLRRNSLLSIIRAHEAQDAGYRMMKKSEDTGFPAIITIFSAPNYLDAYGNKAAVLRYENNVMNIRQFADMPHPYYLPNFMDVFTWSVPFVSEKVAEFLLCILKQIEEEPEVEDVSAAEKERRAEQIRNKIRSVGKVMVMMNTLRSERESLTKLRGLAGKNEIPRGLLLQGPAAIQKALQDFEGVKSADRQNEARPPIHRTASMGQIQGRWLERKWKKKAESPKTMPALGETQKSVTLPSIQPEVIPHQTE